MTELRTPRLLLRRWQLDDAPRLYDILSRREVSQWLADDFDNPELMASVAAAEERIRDRYSVEREAPYGWWAIAPLDGSAVAGNVALLPLPNNEHGEVEIGWWLHPDSHGRGYASEAAEAILAHGFAYGLPEIHAVMYPDNHPSAGVATRLGMSELEQVVDQWYPGVSRHFVLVR